MANANTSYNVAPNVMDGLGGVMPTGAIVAWATASAPSGWLVCDGSSVVRTDYPDLYAVIGFQYGGFNTPNFNLPNLTQRLIRGAGGAYTINTSGGADSITLAANQIAPHGHSVNDPGHSHTLTNVAQQNQFNNGTAGVNRLSELSGSVAATNTATTGLTVTSTINDTAGNPVGAQQAVNIANPYFVLNYIIKAL